MSLELFSKIRTVLKMIKFEHSVFALPFALTAAVLAARGSGLAWADVAAKFAWIVVAMVAARSAAMAFNRVADAEIDAANPRTRMREIPAGVISKSFTWVFVAFWSGALMFAAYMLNPLCFRLSPVALAIVLGYSYTKRFTVFSHLVLGFALGIAPAAAWIAIRGSLDWPILLLAAAVTLWTAGFDIIYSCQDHDFDREVGLHSVPARLGIRNSLLVSRGLHVAMIGLLVWLSRVLGLGGLSVAGIAVVAALLVYEHSLVRADDLSRVNAAFFTVNGFVSVLFFVFWAADVLWV
ncbi:MAG: putative 4-hydroxybenzoate polyprenyltransferase [Acidobacteria bacterium]|nr:putative 4-hydroxybenzoate polyprenyltransferase [Acidobacteriota bacterium]